MRSASSTSSLNQTMSSLSVESIEDSMKDTFSTCSIPVARFKKGNIGVLSLETIRSLLSNDFSSRFVLVDTRDCYDYNKGHVEGALNIFYPEKCEEFFFKNGDVDKIPIFYCNSDMKRSLGMASILQSFDKVYNFGSGGEKTYYEIYVMEGGYRKFMGDEVDEVKQLFEETASEVPLILSPSMAIPLRRIFSFADPVTYGRLQLSCTQMRDVSKSIAVERVIDLDLGFNQSRGRLYRQFLWNGKPLNDVVVGQLIKPQFKLAIGTYSLPFHEEITTELRELLASEIIIKAIVTSLKRLKVSEIRMIQTRPFTPTGKLVIELIKNFKVGGITGCYLFGGLMKSPELESIDVQAWSRRELDQENHYHLEVQNRAVLEEDEKKEIEEFIIDNRATLLKCCGAPMTKDILEHVIQSWATGNRSIDLFVCNAEFSPEDLKTMTDKLEGSGLVEAGCDGNQNHILTRSDNEAILFTFGEEGHIVISRAKSVTISMA